MKRVKKLIKESPVEAEDLVFNGKSKNRWLFKAIKFSLSNLSIILSKIKFEFFNLIKCNFKSNPLIVFDKSFTNFFENKIPGINKINMNIINDYLQNTISNDPPLDSDYIQIKNLSKCVTIKTSSDIQNKNIKITQCEDSYIYINTYIVNCKIVNSVWLSIS